MRRIVLRPAVRSPEPPPAHAKPRGPHGVTSGFPVRSRGPCRQLHAEVPPRVEYSLTELGRSLIPILDSLIEWAPEHFTAVAGNNPR